MLSFLHETPEQNSKTGLLGGSGPNNTYGLQHTSTVLCVVIEANREDSEEPMFEAGWGSPSSATS